MAKPELGTKRICPETGRKFYDLNRDPIVSPYTGMSYPLSFFEETTTSVKEQEEPEEAQEADTENTEVEMVSLEEADDEVSGGEDIPDIDDDDVDLGDDDDDDTFLQDDDEDDDDDMSGIISVNSDEEEN